MRFLFVQMPQRVLPTRPEPRTSLQFVQQVGTILKLHKDTLRFTQHLFERLKVKISIGNLSSRTYIGLLLQPSFCSEKRQILPVGMEGSELYLFCLLLLTYLCLAGMSNKSPMEEPPDIHGLSLDCL